MNGNQIGTVTVMVSIRRYHPSDAEAVGKLIANIYREFNLDFATAEEQALLLGPFRHAYSTEQSHQEAIAEVISAQMVCVAEDCGEIVGVLRGKPDKLQSLFVRKDHHRRGIGRRLVETFEQACIRQGASTIRVAATLYAVPFYQKLGYKKTTGVRPGWSFEGSGLIYQPMKKQFHHNHLRNA